MNTDKSDGDPCSRRQVGVGKTSLGGSYGQTFSGSVPG